MKVTILNGNTNDNSVTFDDYLTDLSYKLQEMNHTTEIFKLREMNIKQCIGCFDCWIKTTGECIYDDDSREICRTYINSDFVLLASPVIMGFTSALLKKANEKLLPLFHPYFKFKNGEVHHAGRYTKYPHVGLLLEMNEETDDEDLSIITELYQREALNLKTSLCFVKLTTDPVNEICNEINRL